MRCFGALLLWAVLVGLPAGGRAAEGADEAQKAGVGQVRVTEQSEPDLIPRHSLVYSNLLAVRVNPLGLEDAVSLGYRLRLYNDPGILWRDAHVGLAFTPTINAAASRIGGTVTVKPIAVLSLSAGYYFVVWYGTFDYLYSVESASDDHSDSTIEEPADPDNGYSTVGSELELRAHAIAKVGPVVLSNDLRFFYATYDLKDNDELYYQPRIDALIANSGWALTNDTDLLYLSDFGLVAGLRNSVVHAFYEDDHFGPGQDTENINTPAVRLGPLVAYVFYDDPSIWFNKPTVLLIVNWWLKHRFRTGQDVHQAAPYAVLGFKCEGDLWGSR